MTNGLPCSNLPQLHWAVVKPMPPSERDHVPDVSIILRDIEQLAGAVVGVLVDLGEIRKDVERLLEDQHAHQGRS